MIRSIRSVTRASILAVFASSFIALGGCGFNRLEATLPDLMDGITLSQIRSIQQDRSLTNDERRAAIREAIGAPETPEGDRLVNFLLNLNIQ